MIRLLTAFLLSTSISAFAGTALQFPRFSAFDFSPFTSSTSPTFGGTFKVPAADLSPMSQNWGVKMGYVWQHPNAGSIAATSRMGAEDAQSIYRAVSGAAKVSQQPAKLLAVNILKMTGYGVLASVALDLGIDFINNTWINSNKNSTCYEGWNGGFFTLAKPSLVDSNPSCSAGMLAGMSIARADFVTCGLVVGNGGYTCNLGWSPTKQITTTPISKADWENLASNISRPLTDAELEEMLRLGFAVPVEKPVATVVIANGNDLSHLSAAALADLLNMGYFTDSQLTVNDGAPHKDPVTGQDVQPKLAVEAAPDGGIRVTSYDQPINTDGTPATNPDGTPKPNQESKDPCAANPDSVSCSSLGSLDPSADPVPTTHDVSLTSGTLSTAGSCPAPRSLTLAGHAVVMSFQPICDASSTYIRPFVLLASAVVSTFIFVGGLKS